MRNIILAILVFASSSLFAQKFEIGLNSGNGLNTNLKHPYPEYNMPQGSQSFPNSPLISVKGIYNHKNWQYGISLEYRRIAYLQKDFKMVYIGPLPPEYPGSIQIDFPEPNKCYEIGNTPVIPVKFFVNRKIKLHRFETYAGFSVGYMFIENNARKFQVNTESITPNKNGYNALSAGAQAGTTYFITKRLGLNAELTGDYIRFHCLGDAKQMFSFPLSLGVRYKL